MLRSCLPALAALILALSAGSQAWALIHQDEDNPYVETTYTVQLWNPITQAWAAYGPDVHTGEQVAYALRAVRALGFQSRYIISSQTTYYWTWSGNDFAGGSWQPKGAVFVPEPMPDNPPGDSTSSSAGWASAQDSVTFSGGVSGPATGGSAPAAVQPAPFIPLREPDREITTPLFPQPRPAPLVSFGHPFPANDPPLFAPFPLGGMQANPSGVRPVPLGP